MITVEEGDGLDGQCDECEAVNYYHVGIAHHAHVQLCEQHFRELRDKINSLWTGKDA